MNAPFQSCLIEQSIPRVDLLLDRQCSVVPINPLSNKVLIWHVAVI